MKKWLQVLIKFGMNQYYRFESLIKYGFFGVCTTIVNFIVHFTCLGIVDNKYFATGVSWVVAVFFAYLTNRFLVFKSTVKGFKPVFMEVTKFVSFRVASLGMEELIMFVLWGVLGINDKFVKVFAQILVILSNYVFSKLFIFSKPKEEEA